MDIEMADLIMDSLEYHYSELPEGLQNLDHRDASNARSVLQNAMAKNEQPQRSQYGHAEESDLHAIGKKAYQSLGQDGSPRNRLSTMIGVAQNNEVKVNPRQLARIDDMLKSRLNDERNREKEVNKSRPKGDPKRETPNYDSPDEGVSLQQMMFELQNIPEGETPTNDPAMDAFYTTMTMTK